MNACVDCSKADETVKLRKDGAWRCAACKTKKWARENPEKHRALRRRLNKEPGRRAYQTEYQRAWRARNAQKLRAQGRVNYRKHIEARRASERRYREANADRIRLRAKAYRARPEVQEQRKAYEAQPHIKARRRAAARARREADPEGVRAKGRRHYLNNADERKRQQRERWARKAEEYGTTQKGARLIEGLKSVLRKIEERQREEGREADAEEHGPAGSGDS